VKSGWEIHEAYIQELLGLDSTPASGAKWQAPGDAVDNHHPSDTVFPLLADAKFTESQSYSVSAKFMRQQTAQAAEAGKRFILPLRFWPRGQRQPEDYVVLSLEDFHELLEMARERRIADTALAEAIDRSSGTPESEWMK
jgi:hypothetical protein